MEHLIELKDVYKIYHMGDEDVHALDGVSLTIDKGEFVAIVGQSGSGKSTAMNIIGCLDVPTSAASVTFLCVDNRFEEGILRECT